MLVLYFLLTLALSIVTPVFSDEDYYHVSACCTYRGPDFEDLEYILVSSFNNHNEMQYNSTRHNWIGFTPYSIGAAQIWNRDPNDEVQRILEMKLLCQDNLHFIRSLGNLTSTPNIMLKSVMESDGKHPAMLVCSAYNFYPKQIKLTWLRNGQEVTEGVSYSDVMSDGNLYYQIQSHLEYFPTSGEKFSCMVKHLSLHEPKLVDWDQSLPLKTKVQIAIGLTGLILGLAVLSFGLIYKWKKSAAYKVCQGRAVVPMKDPMSET